MLAAGRSFAACGGAGVWIYNMYCCASRAARPRVVVARTFRAVGPLSLIYRYSYINTIFCILRNFKPWTLPFTPVPCFDVYSQCTPHQLPTATRTCMCSMRMRAHTRTHDACANAPGHRASRIAASASRHRAPGAPTPPRCRIAAGTQHENRGGDLKIAGSRPVAASGCSLA